MGFLVAGLVLYVVVLPGVLGFALLRGGRSERHAAIAFTLAAAATQLAVIGARWRAPDIPLMAVDAAFFVGLVWIAHRSRSFWPIWAAASQLVGTITHLAPGLQSGILPRAYIATAGVWAFPILAAILVGTMNHARRERLAQP